ncbi:HD domain-containing protein [Marinicrinis sediminis]|uniref:ATP-binding protein n=1 Tax=Marinicrinis sediminis TaxID=1652465 RepID=A0ABW5R9X8_9BACL
MTFFYRDDWREETQLRLQKSNIYLTLKQKAENDPSGQQVLALIDDASDYAYQRTKIIIRYMEEFTLHDGDHLFRVLKLMEQIIPLNTLEKLSVPELMLLILTAFFHDIGMAASEKDIRAWLELWDGDVPSEWELHEYEKFKRFADARPDKQTEIQKLNDIGMYSKANTLKKYLISEYIRITHADRARHIIAGVWNGKIKYKDIDLTNEFAQLCFSHNEEVFSLLELDMSLLCGQDVIVCLPFIGVVLRLSDILDFDAKRTPTVLFSHLGVKNSVSLQEWMKHRSVDAWSISPSNILFQARCEHPAIEATIQRFCDLIDKELIECNSVLSNLSGQSLNNGSDYYYIKLAPKVDRSKIGAKKDLYGKPVYQYKDTQFTLSKTQVIELLMGTKLYGNPEVALRELLQNSIDACLVRQALEKSWGNQFNPEIIIEFKTENNENILTVIDNGIGMDQYIIDNYYSKVGSSFYKSADFYDLKSQASMTFTPTSRFGIGVLSCFMVSDTLKVDTRRLYDLHDSSEPIQVVVEGHESIFWIQTGERKQPGTTTEVVLHQNNPWKHMSEQKFFEFVSQTIPNPPFSIVIKYKNKSKQHTSDSFLNTNSQFYKDFNWNSYNYVNKFELDICDTEFGMDGKVIIGLLEKNKMPVDRIEVSSKEVSISGIMESFTLSTSITVNTNSISKSTDSIEIDDQENVNTSSGSSKIIESKSLLSLHGIEIPMDLFPSSWSSRNQLTRLDWPFPAYLVVDINGNRDIDLNSARTEVTYNEKWVEFAEDLSFVVCRELSKKVSVKYWERLKEIWNVHCKDEKFSIGLKRVT